MSSPPPDLIVTLVHGTFAGKAKWTRQGSILWEALHKALESKFGPEGFLITRIDWGRFNNSQSARLHGADILSEHIQSFLSENPTSRHVLIGHSHGGNVILYALTDPDTRNATTGIVSIGTPFLRCDRRNLALLIATLSGVMSLIVSVFFFPLLLSNVGRLLTWVVNVRFAAFTAHHYPTYLLLSVPNVLLRNGIFLLFLLMVAFAYFVWVCGSESIGNWVEERARKVSQLYDMTPIDRIPTYCYRVEPDEASVLLRVAAWMDDIPSEFTAAPAITILGAICGVALGVRSVISTRHVTWQSPAFNIGDIYSFPFQIIWRSALFTGVILGPLVIVLLFITILRDQPLGYGWQFPGFTWLVRLSADRSPVGASEAQVIAYEPQPFIDYFGKLTCFFVPLHLLLHEHPKVAEEIANRTAAMAERKQAVAGPSS